MSKIMLATILVVATASAVQAQNADLARGAYLVNTVMTCNNCHTPMGPNGPQFDKAFSGGLHFDEPPFKVTASNITPDKDTGIGTWTEAQLKTFLTTGVRPNGVQVAPIMPTGYYKILTSGDLNAIVAYLRSVPAIRNEVPAPDYRAPMFQDVPPGAGQPATTASLNDKIGKGFYLATIAHCMECHTPMEKGRHQFSTSLGQGGQEFSGPFGKSVARNITSDKAAGIGAWTDDEVKRAITQGVSKDGTRLKPPMGYPYYARMTADDLDAIVAWLRTLPPKS